MSMLATSTLTPSRDSGQAPSASLRTESSLLPSRRPLHIYLCVEGNPIQPFDFAQDRLFPSRLGKGSENSLQRPARRLCKGLHQGRRDSPFGTVLSEILEQEADGE